MPHNHLSDLKGKFWNDREIIHSLEFLPDGTFQAYYETERYLKDLGYCLGSMCRNEPIGFAYGAKYVAKWYNISNTEKKLLDGVILPHDEFREGGTIVLFFTPPRY